MRAIAGQRVCIILAEGAIALSVTLSEGALFASGKLLQFPSSLIVKVILAFFMGASAQQYSNFVGRYGQCDMAIPTRPVTHELVGESKFSTHTHIPSRPFGYDQV